MCIRDRIMDRIPHLFGADGKASSGTGQARFIDAMKSYDTVSYTHLDVYKRQTECRVFFDVTSDTLKGMIIDEAIGLSAVIINETVGDKICLLYTSRCV